MKIRVSVLFVFLIFRTTLKFKVITLYNLCVKRKKKQKVYLGVGVSFLYAIFLIFPDIDGKNTGLLKSIVFGDDT